MPVSKSRFKRKTQKRYDTVRFEVDFIEGAFELPDQKHLPIRVARKLTSQGDIDALVQWLIEAKVDAETLTMIDDLERDEMTAFMDAWDNGSIISSGK